ncbi:MAG TPA: DUF6285 domain-containing protein [Polymorphobacter sp.]|jgi:hypothetical protein|nr:DUF6285 domain-containing protein [Polymorphobacter sp.]
MAEQPTVDEILATVARFLRDTAVPQLAGHAGFHARVAANAIDLVRRELELRPALDHEAHARLTGLLGHDGPLDALDAELCARIADDGIAIDDPALLDHLWRTTLGKLAVDQPGYASYRAALTGRSMSAAP